MSREPAPEPPKPYGEGRSTAQTCAQRGAPLGKRGSGTCEPSGGQGMTRRRATPGAVQAHVGPHARGGEEGAASAGAGAVGPLACCGSPGSRRRGAADPPGLIVDDQCAYLQ